MKNGLQLLFAITWSLFIAGTCSAQQTLIHYWDFNSFAPGLTGGVNPAILVPIKAHYSILDTNKATISYSTVTGTSSSYSTYWDNYIPGDTINAQMADTAGSCLRIWNPSDSMQLLFNIPTTGYNNITIKFETQKSSLTQAQLYQAYDYSTDSGKNWKTSGLSIPGDSAIYHVWALVTVKINDTTVNNGGFIFRIRFKGQNTGTSGNNRFDNVTVHGDSIKKVTGITPVAITRSYSLYPSPASNKVYIATGSGTEKTIIINNMEGKTLYQGKTTEKTGSVSVAALSSGVYFVIVTDNESGQVTHLKFIKK